MPGESRVVAGVSGSPGSLAALRYAEYLVLAHGAALVPVLAWELPGGDRAARVQPAAGLNQAWCGWPASRRTMPWQRCGADPGPSQVCSRRRSEGRRAGFW
jgi:hypothetical protein